MRSRFLGSNWLTIILMYLDPPQSGQSVRRLPCMILLSPNCAFDPQQLLLARTGKYGHLYIATTTPPDSSTEHESR
jgi:hypothetical protein